MLLRPMARVRSIMLLLLYYSWNPISYTNFLSFLERLNLRIGRDGPVGMYVSRISPLKSA
jgi:hypothetical protein